MITYTAYFGLGIDVFYQPDFGQWSGELGGLLGPRFGADGAGIWGFQGFWGRNWLPGIGCVWVTDR